MLLEGAKTSKTALWRGAPPHGKGLDPKTFKASSLERAPPQVWAPNGLFRA